MTTGLSKNRNRRNLDKSAILPDCEELRESLVNELVHLAELDETMLEMLGERLERRMGEGSV